MHLTTATKLILLINLTLVHNVFSQPTTLCSNNEKTFFSCTINDEKILSLCGLLENKHNFYLVNYKYGISGNTELIYPSPSRYPIDNSMFSYFSYHRFQTEYSRIYFTNKGYRYTVYRDYHGEISDQYEAGVIVRNISTGRDQDFQCSVIHENDMSQLFNILPLEKAPDL